MAMALNLVLIGPDITLRLAAADRIHWRAAVRAASRKAAFVFGWLLSLAVVVTVTALATGNNPPEPSTAASWRRWRRRSRSALSRHHRDPAHRVRGRPSRRSGRSTDSMSWLAQARVRHCSPGADRRGATVMEAKLSSWESYLALVPFCLLASASYLF
jgi:hypothetical protein